MGCIIVALIVIFGGKYLITEMLKYPEIFIAFLVFLIPITAAIYQKQKEKKTEDSDKEAIRKIKEKIKAEKKGKSKPQCRQTANYSYGEECRRKEEERQKKQQKQQELSESKLKDYVVFDLETTGLSPQYYEIIEIGAVKVINGEIEEVFSELVCPNSRIPQKIIDITHITNETVEGKPSINKVLPEFLDFAQGYILVGHNVTFDSSFLSVAAQKLNLRYSAKLVDTLSMSRRAFPDMRHHKLSDMCDVFGIANNDAHRALSDCYATQQIFERLQCEVSPAVFRAKRIELVPRTPEFTPKTQAIAELIYMLGDVSADGTVEESEVLTLKNWLIQNEEYCKEYPLNRVGEVIKNVLEDDVLEQSELDEMLHIFLEITEPKYEKKIMFKTTETAVCLDGEFKHASKREVIDELTQSGFEVKSTMSGKVEYLIVGDLGSYEWGYDGFGQKILKAMELQSKGKDVKIVKEKVFFAALQRYKHLNV